MTNCEICSVAPATVKYFDCCEHYYGTPMCAECGSQNQGAMKSCEVEEVVPL